jgi:hypothetical protein
MYQQPHVSISRDPVVRLASARFCVQFNYYSRPQLAKQPRAPPPPIDGQMGQARWASTGTARKSTARARHHSASAGTRHDLDSAWAAGPAHGTSTGTT